MASQKSRGQGRPKKKRSFLVKARKYGRKGMYGRGKHVDEDTYNYFVRVMERLRNEFEDSEEQEIFVDNVFQQTVEKEMDLMSNQVISKVIEKLIVLAKPEIFQRFAEIIKKQARIICTDPYASHVLEKMMYKALQCLSNSNEDTDDEHVNFYKVWLLSMSQFAFNNMEDFIVDTYASHILRTGIQCMTGVDVNVYLMKSKRSRKHLDEAHGSVNHASVPKHLKKPFLDVFQGFAEQLMSWAQLPDLVHSENSSAVIQTVMHTLHQTIPRQCEKFLGVVIQQVLEPFQGNVFEASSASHLLETCLTVSDEDMFNKLFNKYFQDNLKNLAVNHNSKFAVVKLLDAIKDKEMLKKVFEELSPNMEDIFASECGEVILALARCCQRLSEQQARFVQQLMQCFHCYEPESRQISIVPLVMKLITYEAFYDETEDKEAFSFNYSGSQLVQTLLHFNKPIKIINSMLNMDTGLLKEMFCDPFGSRVMDAFIASQSVGEKSRDLLVQKLAGTYSSLACSKHGSRSLDALWESCNIKWRMSIGQELLEKEAALSSNMFGRILFNKYALPLLKRQKSDWKESQEREEKKRKLFSDLIKTSDDKSKEAKRPKKKTKTGS